MDETEALYESRCAPSLRLLEDSTRPEVLSNSYFFAEDAK